MMTTKRLNSTTRQILLERIAASGLRPLIDAFNDGDQVNAFLCAGAVRDAFLTVLRERGEFPRDFDIGISGTTPGQFRKIASNFAGKLNRYGGISIRLKSGTSADIWRFEDTVGIRATNSPPDINHVLRSFILDVNAIAFNLRENTFVDCGALRSFRQGIIDIVPDALMHHQSTFAARAILLGLRFAFGMSDRLEQFTLTNFEPSIFKYELSKMPAEWRESGRLIFRAPLASANAQDLIALVRQTQSLCHTALLD